MLERKKEIYVQLQNPHEISKILKEIRTDAEQVKKLFAEYDNLNLEENTIFDNWSTYIEEFSEKLEHISL